jgi:hypothetical protein
MMEGFGFLLGLAFLGVLIALPIWIVSSIVRLRREVEDERIQNSSHWRDLTARLYVLESRLKEQEKTAPSSPIRTRAPSAIPEVAGERHAASPAPQAPVESAPLRSPSHPPIVPVLPTPLWPPEQITPLPQPEPESQPPSEPESAKQPALAASLPQLPSPPQPHVSPPTFTHSQAQAASSRGFDFEEMLGTNWLNKIGISILVLGLAFFLAYQLHNLGPGGKVLLGVALSGAMIAIGVRYESNQRYRILARASAAGGWALLYFVSYAIYHVPAAHIVDSRELDFLLMLIVAAAIVSYSLRYRSQATTALALVLSYLTVGIHHASVYSLIASVLLALTVVTLALRMNWFALELFGILATYFNHLLWVWPVIEAMGPRRVEFAEFRTSVALLGFYWLLFRLSYIYRRISDDAQEALSTASALANGFCLLAMFKYQSIHPEWAFWALLALGAVELGLSVLAARRRRTAFIVLATLGSTLLVAALPFRYSGSSLSILWLAAAEAFLFAGVFLREVVFRRIGMITFAVVAGQMILDTGAGLILQRFENIPGILPDYPMAVLFATAAALCYANSHWVRLRWRALFEHEFDSAIAAGFSYVGGLLVLLACWFAWPGMWTAVAWGVLALVADVSAKKFSQRALAVQGNLIAVLVVIRLITLNLFTNGQWHGVSLRLITVGLTAVLLYAAAPFARAADENEEGPWSQFTAAYTWTASILIAILLWDELAPGNVALGWMALGLVLLEIGLLLRAGFLRWQGFTALAASFAQMFLANLDLSTPDGHSPRVTRVLLLAAAYLYADWRLRLSGASEAREHNLVATVFSYCGIVAISALLYVELLPSWVAAGWSALSLVLIAAALALKRRDYLHQSFLVALAVAGRVFTYNFIQPVNFAIPFWQSEKYYVGTAIALLFAALPLAFVVRRSNLWSEENSFLPDSRPEQLFFFVPFALLTLLIAMESTRGWLTVNWGIEGLAFFLLALLVGERSFRLAGLGVLLVCVAKIFMVDVWGLDPQSRYVTLILLGGALLLVSFLYTKHKEKFQRYL